MLSKIKVIIFFNNERGLKVLSYLKKKNKDTKNFCFRKKSKERFFKKIAKKKLNFK